MDVLYWPRLGDCSLFVLQEPESQTEMKPSTDSRPGDTDFNNTNLFVRWFLKPGSNSSITLKWNVSVSVQLWLKSETLTESEFEFKLTSTPAQWCLYQKSHQQMTWNENNWDTYLWPFCHYIMVCPYSTLHSPPHSPPPLTPHSYTTLSPLLCPNYAQYWHLCGLYSESRSESWIKSLLFPNLQSNVTLYSLCFNCFFFVFFKKKSLTGRRGQCYPGNDANI